MKIVFRSCHRDIELRRSSSSSSVVVPKWPLSASRKTGGFLARDCVALATILRHGSHLRSLLCNWSGCPIVAEKWCNLYTNIQVHHPGRALAVGPIDLASSFVELLKRFKGRTEKALWIATAAHLVRCVDVGTVVNFTHVGKLNALW